MSTWEERVASVKWEDTTSYSRSDVTREPTSWTAELGPLRITVFKPYFDKAQWYGNVFGGGLKLGDWRFGLAPLESAKTEALRRARAELVALIDALP
jgi:hypothetical protein